eukprot:scaffold107004_cov33-Tisochrysis_lutea.AAC.2
MSRLLMPSCGAASPTPRDAYMIANISLVSERRESSNSTTSVFGARSRGWGYSRMRRSVPSTAPGLISSSRKGGDVTASTSTALEGLSAAGWEREGEREGEAAVPAAFSFCSSWAGLLFDLNCFGARERPIIAGGEERQPTTPPAGSQNAVEEERRKRARKRRRRAIAGDERGRESWRYRGGRGSEWEHAEG